MNVLILSCNTGEGHNSAGKAIKYYFEQNGDVCYMADAIAFRSETISKLVADGHVFIYTKTPKMFDVIYNGAELFSKVRAIFKRIIIAALSLSVVSMLFMMFLGKTVAPLFIRPEDTELLEVSIVGMKLFSLSYLTGWVDMCLSSYFTALERPTRSLLTSFFGTLVFPILSLLILTPALGLNGVWLSSLIACTASAVFTAILASTMKLKKRASDVPTLSGE